MRAIMTTLTVLGTGLALAACGSVDERQWMKPSGQKYTTEEFRRDWAECSSKGKLDEACMRSRGWVSVTPTGTSEAKPDPLARDIYYQNQPRPRY
ncbi:MAG TPA: hypothetical protein VNM91_02960 [Dehalococcoidia bacterium]|nr:hypothetical protein [Dehalococcoidia bacterium]